MSFYGSFLVKKRLRCDFDAINLFFNKFDVQWISGHHELFGPKVSFI